MKRLKLTIEATVPGGAAEADASQRLFLIEALRPALEKVGQHVETSGDIKYVRYGGEPETIGTWQLQEV